jgi:phosphinothricin acetyltransferase
MSTLFIRKAVETDLEVINFIYNHYVLHSTCTYQTEPSTPAERFQWFTEHHEPYFVKVAEVEGKVLGWSSISRFHPRCAYEGTAENSIYVHPERLYQGIGSSLMADLIQDAKKAGFHTLIALISADQRPSVKLHEKSGFVLAGRLKEVGNKFGRWLDVDYMQLML